MIPQGLDPRKAVRSLAFGSAWAQVNWFTDCETAFSTEKKKPAL